VIARWRGLRSKSQSSRQEKCHTGEIGDALKVSLSAQPIDGRANEACIEFLAKVLKMPQSSVTIASGATHQRAQLLLGYVICVQERGLYALRG
jgi:uncharacterized protein YggU (UPF0235/DUF167 family)